MPIKVHIFLTAKKKRVLMYFSFTSCCPGTVGKLHFRWKFLLNIRLKIRKFIRPREIKNILRKQFLCFGYAYKVCSEVLFACLSNNKNFHIIHMSTIKYYLHASSMMSSLLTDSSKREQKLASVFFGKSV